MKNAKMQGHNCRNGGDRRTAESWDNPGLMTGDREAHVHKILVALDIDDNVIDEAEKSGADMIITHHPLIFRPVSSVNADNKTGRYLMRLIKKGINVYSAHTNLDVSPIGTNATLAELLGLREIEFLMPPNEDIYSMGRVGRLEKAMKTEDFGELVKKKLGLDNIAISKAGDYVSKIGLCTGHGSGTEFLLAAKAKGCDGFVTGDVGYHEAQEAIAMGLSLFDGTHYGTEVIVTGTVAAYLRGKFDIDIIESKTDGQTIKII